MFPSKLSPRCTFSVFILIRKHKNEIEQKNPGIEVPNFHIFFSGFSLNIFPGKNLSLFHLGYRWLDGVQQYLFVKEKMCAIRFCEHLCMV